MAGDSRAAGQAILPRRKTFGLTVTGVLLERPSEECNLLAGDAAISPQLAAKSPHSRVEEGVNDLSGETVLLVLVLRVSFGNYREPLS